MRIEANQVIAGYPARLVRQLMRETLGRPVTVRWASEVLGCTRSDAEQALQTLEKEGWICQVGDHLEPSLKGSALAQATAAKPLTRVTASRLVDEVLDRVATINRDSRYAYRVDKLVIFGSYLDPRARPNDVDIGVRLIARYSAGRQEEAEQSRRIAHGPGFRNTFVWAAWPKLEIMKFLKSRSRGLSIQELSDWIEGQNHSILYDAGKRKEPEGGRRREC